MKCPVNETVFSVHYGSFAVFLCVILHILHRTVSHFKYCFLVMIRVKQFFRLPVVFKQFYSQISCGVEVSRISRFFQFFLNVSYPFFYVSAMVYMYVAENVVARLYAAGEILLVVVAVLFVVFKMPLPYLVCHLRIKVSFIVKKIQSLIHIYNNVKQQLNPTSGSERGRYHRDTEKRSELVAVNDVTTFLCLVIHV